MILKSPRIRKLSNSILVSIIAELLAVKCAGVNEVKMPVIGTNEPLEKLGTVVATVARMLVPKFSAAIVT